jgi:hypothetical protein
MGERAGLFVYGGDLEVGMASHPCLRDAAAPATRKDFSFTDELEGRTNGVQRMPCTPAHEHHT